MKPDETDNKQQMIAAILNRAFHLEGVHCGESEEDICVRGKAVDVYLFIGALAQRMAAGDVVLVEKGDSCKKSDYFDRLLRSLSQDELQTT